jgi:transcription termination factor NusB
MKKLVEDVFSDFEIVVTDNLKGYDIVVNGISFKIYPYTKDELKDDESWYLTFYGRYHESKWIKVIPGYEREFLENFRDEVIPVLKNINTLDSLIGDYLTNSMNGNIEMKLKSIRRDNIIQKLQN